MPIRLVDGTAKLARIASVLASSAAAFTGTSASAASRTGAMPMTTGDAVSAFTGAFQLNAARTGTIASTLGNAPASMPGTSSGPPTFNFYISATGSDSNPGTLSQPWAITALNTKQVTYAAKTVGLLDGTYNVYSLLTPLAFDQYAFTIAGGNSTTSTVIKAVNQGGAIINCKSGSSYGGGNSAGPSVIGLLSEYITLDGLVLTGHTRRCICVGGASAIQEPTRRGITIQNCELYDNSGVNLGAGLNISQIELNDSLGTIIRNNYFHDNVGYAANDADHFSAVEVWVSALGIFEYNTIKNQACGFQGKAQGEDTYGNIFRYNHIDLGTSTTGGHIGIFGFNEGSNHQANVGRAATEIHHNVIIAQHPVLLRNVYLDTRTIRFFHPVKVYSNTLVVPQASGGVGATLIVDSSALCEFYDNIAVRVSGSGDLQGMLHATELLNSKVDYNHYFQSGTANFISSPAYDGTSRTNRSFAGFVTAMGSNANGTTIDQHGAGAGTDPLFVGSGADALFYVLQAGSPCKSSGSSDGTSGGSSVDKGAWGNSPPAVIGRS